MSRIRWGWTLPPLLAAIAALAIYLPRLMPGVGLWDTAEFQTIGSTLGIAHPTGYPAYSILLGIARGKHHDAAMLIGATQTFQHLEAINAREADIQNDKVELFLGGGT